MTVPTLCLDIGSGTQDVLYFFPDREPENCPKFVLPAPAVRIGRLIRDKTFFRIPLFLSGRTMGGGVGRAISAHIQAGIPLAATERAALTMNDDLDCVRKCGVQVTDTCPNGYEEIELADFAPAWWKRFFEAAELPYPERIAACAQDHGFHPGESNRLGRFKLWETFLTDNGGRPEALVYDVPPVTMTRLREVYDAMGGGYTADTGAAAVLGALYVDDIEQESYQHGLTLVNVGNSHLIAFLLYAGRIHGVYEQHTGCVTSESLANDLARFRNGSLTGQEVFDNRGHGCLTLDLPEAARGFDKTYVLGPRRAMLDGWDVEYPAPGGDMMLAGSFGMVKGLQLLGKL